MRLKINLQILVALMLLNLTSLAVAKEYIIYSIVQEVPMGDEGEKIKKNFYVNLGSGQGLKQGTVLDVFRAQSRVDPYNGNKRHLYNVKIGQLKIIHSEENSAIAKLDVITTGDDTPLFEQKHFMIGDQVKINIGN